MYLTQARVLPPWYLRPAGEQRITSFGKVSPQTAVARVRGEQPAHPRKSSQVMLTAKMLTRRRGRHSLSNWVSANADRPSRDAMHAASITSKFILAAGPLFAPIYAHIGVLDPTTVYLELASSVSLFHA